MASSSELPGNYQVQFAVMTLKMAATGKRSFRSYGVLALLLILSFFIESTWAHRYGCNATYKEISAKHTLCLQQPPLCEVMDSGVSKKEAREILDMHNNYRQKVALGKVPGFPQAANMMRLEWDDELAAVAQAHANQCEFKHDCYPCRRVPRFTTGQNLFLSSSASADAVSTNWKSAIQSWWDEALLLDKREIHRFNGGGEAGHLTQLMWATSIYVGCGRAKFKIRGDPIYRIIYTCNYGPVGNVNDLRIYEPGAPCSQCPDKAKCSRTMHGLCSFPSSEKNEWHGLDLRKPTTQQVVRISRGRPFDQTFISNPWQYPSPLNIQLQKIIPVAPQRKVCRCDEKLMQKMQEDVLKMYAGRGVHPIVKIKCECPDSELNRGRALASERSDERDEEE